MCFPPLPLLPGISLCLHNLSKPLCSYHISRLSHRTAHKSPGLSQGWIITCWLRHGLVMYASHNGTPQLYVRGSSMSDQTGDMIRTECGRLMDIWGHSCVLRDTACLALPYYQWSILIINSSHSRAAWGSSTSWAGAGTETLYGWYRPVWKARTCHMTAVQPHTANNNI